MSQPIEGVGVWDGEPAGIRTLDPMIKSHVLYQLSYRLAFLSKAGGP